jgi:predicted ABC-type ATPase
VLRAKATTACSASWIRWPSEIEFGGRENLLEPDAIARRIRPEFPHRAGVSAGKEVLRRTLEYLRAGEGFAVETTLAGNWTSSAIKGALDRSFFTRVFYICLDNPERSIQRVRERVAQDGHDVPDVDVRRRYARSLSDAHHVLQIVQCEGKNDVERSLGPTKDFACGLVT